MNGIMSSIAEFYSRNLANDVIKGTQQKVAAGGTPHVAPLAYLNIRQVDGGKEARTVVLDPKQAEHVAWAFEAYASGDYSLRRLAAALEQRGLLQRPTPKRAARPLPPNKLHEILRNRYCIGLRHLARRRARGQAPDADIGGDIRAGPAHPGRVPPGGKALLPPPALLVGHAVLCPLQVAAAIYRRARTPRRQL